MGVGWNLYENMFSKMVLVLFIVFFKGIGLFMELLFMPCFCTIWHQEINKKETLKVINNTKYSFIRVLNSL